MLNKEEISKIICKRCNVPIGHREWTVACTGHFVHNDNCDQRHPHYKGE